MSLLEKGLFRFDFIKEIKHPETKYIDKLIERCISQLILEVTTGCNFKCRYCHQPGKSNDHSRMMTMEVAYNSIDYLFEHSKDANEVAITFYGGEPLLNFELIKLVVLYTNKKFESKSIFYNMTTNASLLTNEIISFLVENNFSLLISLDGNEDTQNLHRKYSRDGGETFNVVWNNILSLRKTYPKYFDMNVSFNAVILPDEDPSNVMEFFKVNNIPKTAVTISNADLTGIDYNPTRKVFNQNRIIFEENYKEMLEKFENKSQLLSCWHHNGPCVPAARRLFISVDGDFYPCEKVEGARDCLLGNLDVGINIEKAIEILNIGSLTTSDCKACWALRFCTICVRQCLDNDCISSQRKKISCKQLKENALSFFVEYIENKKRCGQ